MFIGKYSERLTSYLYDWTCNYFLTIVVKCGCFMVLRQMEAQDHPGRLSNMSEQVIEVVLLV